MKTLHREKLKVVAETDASDGRYVLDDQAGFLMRVAMQRHTSIFTSRMIEGLTQTQFAALAKLYEVNDPKDRRRRAVALTERGRTVTESAMAVASDITTATLGPLTADEQRQITKLLRKLG